MSLAENHMAVIPKAVDESPALNYKDMVMEAIKAIEEMSGKRWTNYNASDTGITMLEYLCYALLDLGYKSTFPIEDLLTNKNNRLKTKNHFYKAREIFFSNPVTVNDFRKLLIDRLPDLKNAWVRPVKSPGCFPGSFDVFLELTDELKEKWILLLDKGEDDMIYSLNDASGTSLQQMSLIDPASFKKRVKQLKSAADVLLLNHRNLGDIFTKVHVLRPVKYKLQGTFYFTLDADPARVVAWLYYMLNNRISRFIDFCTYPELLEEGMTTDEILAGTRLENGFIRDADLEPMKEGLDLQQLEAALAAHKEVTGITNFAISTPRKTNKGIEYGPWNSAGLVKFQRHTSPFFDHTDIVQAIKEGDIVVYTGNKRLKQVDQSKVNSLYESLTLRKPVSSIGFESELGPIAPKGIYRDLSTYHSIQSLFPEHYGLRASANYTGFAPEKTGKLKQLKAYLMFFEQIIADHQAQLGKVHHLLSFDSSISIQEALCQTYFSMGIYDSPGAPDILKAFEGGSMTMSNQLDNHARYQWQLFKDNPDNPYENFLSQTKDKEQSNVERKYKLIQHVLSRYGERFLPEVILELNPHYGNYSLAGIEYASEQLKHLHVYSENIGRSYFLATEGTETDPSFSVKQRAKRLFSGLELKFGVLFQLRSYYKGIRDIIDGSKELSAGLSIELSPPDADTTQQTIMVKYYDEALLEMPYENRPVRDTIEQHMKVLDLLIKQTQGFVLIDNALLISNLQDQSWVMVKDGKARALKKLGSKKKEASVHQANLRQIQDIFQRYEQQWTDSEVYLQHDFDDETVLHELMRASGNDYPDDDFETLKSTDPQFHFKVELYLPMWVSKLRQPEFMDLFLREITHQAPLHVSYKVEHLEAIPMTWLLSLRKKWMKTLAKLQVGKTLTTNDLLVVKGLLKFIRSPHRSEDITL